MRKLAFAFAILMLPMALSAREQRIGFVDLDRVTKEYQDFQNAKNELADYIRKWEAERDSLKHVIDSLKAAYQKEKPMLSDEARLRKEQEIQQKETEYRNFWKTIWGPGGKLERKNRELLQPYVHAIDSVIREAAKELGYSLILDLSSAGVLYYNEKDDITDIVIERLNRSYEVAMDTTSMIKPKLAVFPLKEKNNEAMSVQLGSRIQQFAYRALENSPYVELLPLSKINQAVDAEIPSRDLIDQGKCMRIARNIGADLILYGEVTRTGENVSFSFKLISSKTGRELVADGGTSSDRDTDLMIKVGDVVRRMMAQYAIKPDKE